MHPTTLRQPADHHASLLAAEQRLQAAQLASDTAVLDVLLDDRLVFTGPDGALHAKLEDLALHRSGRRSVSALDLEDVTAVVEGATGVTVHLGTLSGTVDGEPFVASVRYILTWVHRPTRGWRLLAAHGSLAGAGMAGADG